MKIDAELEVRSPADVQALARKAEATGFDCLWFNETKHDPFVQLALAAAGTKTVQMGSSIALAFTRSPTTMAYQAWDMQSLSNGRFILGLGSQVRGHIERRFGVRWEPPAPKMREYILALRAVWKCWQEGGDLDFQGRFYKLSLMTPFFNPGPIEHPRVPVFVAGVNPVMCGVAGKVGDGLHVHPLHTRRYLREVVIKGLEKGLTSANRRRDDVQVAASVFAAVGSSEAEIRAVKEAYRQQIAFYASTRTYKGLLELHGWGDVAERLRQLSLRADWENMSEEVTDEMLGEFVVEGSWEGIGDTLMRRYDGLADRLRLYLPYDGSEKWRTLVGQFKA